MQHRFQIDLRGIIELLSNHLYSGPEVFVRELLQNGVDAIRERTNADPAHEGAITFEVHGGAGKPARLIVTDNGVGLAEDEVHQFLATIGQSSKRLGRGGRPEDYLGQFGIGILSCFVVSDEIVVISQSARPGHAPVEWKAKPDGTYSVRTLAGTFEPGTQVCLTAKSDCAEQFTFDALLQQIRHFGRLLPYPVHVTHGKAKALANDTVPPWKREFRDERERTRELLQFGQDLFHDRFDDAVPLRSKAGDVEGVAFIVSHPLHPGARQTHRIYLKHMLLSDKVDNLLPEWAIFVKAVVNANDLRPTASRETLYEDRKLQNAREALGECLKQHLIRTARERPEKMQQLLAKHDLAFKALATQDDEFFRLCIDWFPFETNLGRMTFGEFRQQADAIRYVPQVDSFRQIARVAAAQRTPLINAGHAFETELLEKAETCLEDVRVEKVEPSDFAHELDDLDEAEQDEAADLLLLAEKVLRPFRCRPEAKRFKPAEVPVLLSTDSEGRFLRAVEQSQEVANPLFADVLQNLKPQRAAARPSSHLLFNFANPLVQQLKDRRESTVLRRAVEMLYVQALLLGHHPLSAQELHLLNAGLLDLITHSLRHHGSATE